MNLDAMVNAFAYPEGAKTVTPFGNGHINDTFLVTAEGTEDRYILQRINGYVFVKPAEVMENIRHVTDFLRRKITEEGGDPRRETMLLIPARNLSAGELVRRLRPLEKRTPSRRVTVQVSAPSFSHEVASQGSSSMVSE